MECRLHPQALVTIDPGVLFILEGTGQADRFPGMAWGNGFITDPATIQLYNLSDPNIFFQNIIAVPALAQRTALSAHVYGPVITVSPSLQELAFCKPFPSLVSAIDIYLNCNMVSLNYFAIHIIWTCVLICSQGPA